MEKEVPGDFFLLFSFLLNYKNTEKLEKFCANLQSDELYENNVKISVGSSSCLKLRFA